MGRPLDYIAIYINIIIIALSILNLSHVSKQISIKCCAVIVLTFEC